MYIVLSSIWRGQCRLLRLNQSFNSVVLRYSSKLSSQTSTASAPAVVAKPQNSVESETLVVTTKPLPEITATNDVFAPQTSVKRGIVSVDKQWHDLRIDYSKLIQHYLMLSKIRLTSLVVMTTMAGYALAPGSLSLTTFILCCVGTGLMSCAANSVNQFFEVPFDSQMARTRNRVLVRGLLTPLHAVMYAATCSVFGLSTLYWGVNGLTAALGATNFILYTLVYTPMKRISILNTWIGSIVGAIPPLMGWAACAGTLEPGAWILPGILYAWQFPHFNALSWNLRSDYSQAGYRMMCVTNPDLCRQTAVRYTGVVLVLSCLAPVLEVTTWLFAVASLPLNAYFMYLGWQFQQHSDSSSSRRLFRFSLIHLPLLMVIMLLTKRQWYLTSAGKDEEQERPNKCLQNKETSLSVVSN